MSTFYSQTNPDIASVRADWVRMVASRRNMNSDAIAAAIGHNRADVNRKLAGGDSKGASRRFSDDDMSAFSQAAHAISPLTAEELAALEQQLREEKDFWRQRMSSAQTPGQFLKLLFSAHGTSTLQAAEMIGLDRANLSAFVNDKRKPRDLFIGRIGRSFGLNDDEKVHFKGLIQECYTMDNGRETSTFQNTHTHRAQTRSDQRTSWVERLASEAAPLAKEFALAHARHGTIWTEVAADALSLSQRGLTHHIEHGFRQEEQLLTLLRHAGIQSSAEQSAFLEANQKTLTQTNSTRVK